MLIFATPGAPLSTPKPGGTLKGIQHAHSLGIHAMEMEWVQSVPKNSKHVEAIGILAKSLNFSLTIHAPYYVNLNSKDPSIIDASIKRILDSLSMGQVAGAKSVCVHAAFYNGEDPAKALENVRRATEKMMKLKNKFFPDVNLAYETMGKKSQFGSMEEVLSVSKEFDIYPCIDFAHLHARENGKINSKKEWDQLIDLYVEYLGKKSLSQMHIHYCGIAYGTKGEKNHVPLQESDAKWREFLQVLKKRKIGGILVIESPLLEEDVILLQETYELTK